MTIYVLIAIVIGLSVWASLPERSPRTYSIPYQVDTKH